MKKQYRCDYVSELGWRDRRWFEAENDEDALKEAQRLCAMCRDKLVDGSVKEVSSPTATEDYYRQVIEESMEMR